MPQIASIVLSSEFESYVITQCFDTKDLRLGIIPLADAVTVATPPPKSGAIAAELNVSGWVRPSIVIPGLGAYNTTTNTWDLPSAMEWSVTAPTGGIDVKQFFVIIGGSTTPRDTTGTFIGLTTLASVITIPAGVTTAIKAPWSILGV